MITEIGIMIGFYIVTRMLSMLTSRNEIKIVNWLSLVTIIVTIIVIIDLCFRGFQSTSKLHPY